MGNNNKGRGVRARREKATKKKAKRSRLPLIAAVGLAAVVGVGSLIYRGFSASETQTQTQATPQEIYNSISSLEDLTESKDYKPFHERELGPDEALISFERHFEGQPEVLKESKNISVINLSNVSTLPNNENFVELESRLNTDLQNFCKYLKETIENFPKEKEFKVVLLEEEQNFKSLPYSKENTIQLYLGNKFIEKTRYARDFRGDRIISEKRFRGSTIGDASGRMSYKPGEKEGELNVEFIPNKVFIAPSFSLSKEQRYTSLLNTALGEALHTVFIDIKTKAFKEIAEALMKKHGNEFPMGLLDQSWENFDKVDEGIIHATTLLYLDTNEKWKRHGRAVEKRFQRDKYQHLSPYLEAMRESKIDPRERPAFLLKIYLDQQAQFLYRGKKGIEAYIAKYPPKTK